MTRQQVRPVKGLLAAIVCTRVGGFGVVVQFMASAVLSAGKDLVAVGVSILRRRIGSRECAYLAASGIFTRMDTLSLLCLANAVGCGSIGDRGRDIDLRAAGHSVLAANHSGSWRLSRRWFWRRGARSNRAVQNRDERVGRKCRG